MRKLGFVLTAAILSGVLSAPVAAQDAFEGTIDYQMSAGNGMNMEMKTTVKGTRLRQEMQGSPMGTMVSIIDAGSTTITMLMPAQKTYMRMNVGGMMEQAQAAQAAHGAPQEVKPEDFKPTGEKETIAGHECEHYEYTQGAMTMDMCVAKGLGFMPFSNPGGMSARGGSPQVSATDAAEWREHFGDGFVMLGMEMTQDGTTMTMRATNVEKKSVGDDVFEVPSDYTEMKMPGGPGR